MPRENHRSDVRSVSPAPSKQPTAATEFRVLIVDASPGNREAYRQQIARVQGQTFTFREASSGKEGLRLCRSEPPDCLLLDNRLPDITGLEFVACLRAGRDGPAPPVVFLASQVDGTVGAQALKQGAQGFLIKERITGFDLCRAIHQAIDQVAACPNSGPPRAPGDTDYQWAFRKR